LPGSRTARATSSPLRPADRVGLVSPPCRWPPQGGRHPGRDSAPATCGGVAPRHATRGAPPACRGKGAALTHIALANAVWSSPPMLASSIREPDMRIYIASVYVDDQERALRFYTEVLGFVRKTEITLGDARWADGRLTGGSGRTGAPARTGSPPCRAAPHRGAPRRRHPVHILRRRRRDGRVRAPASTRCPIRSGAGSRRRGGHGGSREHVRKPDPDRQWQRRELIDRLDPWRSNLAGAQDRALAGATPPGTCDPRAGRRCASVRRALSRVPRPAEPSWIRPLLTRRRRRCSRQRRTGMRCRRLAGRIPSRQARPSSRL